jgi:hyperosmotically inducible protein
MKFHLTPKEADMKAIQMVLGMMVFVLLLFGCQSMTGQTTGEFIDDASITAAVKTKLTNYQVSSLARVGVETVNGMVHLTGIVNSDSAKAEATRLAKEVNGVKRVDNDLIVQPE